MTSSDKKLAGFKQLNVVLYNVKDRVILTGRDSSAMRQEAYLPPGTSSLIRQRL